MHNLYAYCSVCGKKERKTDLDRLKVCAGAYGQPIILTLCDKPPEVDANAVRAEVGELAKSTDARYMTAADVRTTLREEYGIDLMQGPSKAIAHSIK